MFYCTDRECRQGDGATDEVLEPGQATTDFRVYSDDDGRIGVATIPAERLVGGRRFSRRVAYDAQRAMA